MDSWILQTFRKKYMSACKQCHFWDVHNSWKSPFHMKSNLAARVFYFRDNHHVDLQLSLSRHVPYGEPEISPVSVTWMPTFQLRSPVTVARMRCTGPQHPWPPQHSWVPWLQWHGYLSRLAAQLSSKLWIHLDPKIFEVKICQNHHSEMAWWKVHTQTGHKHIQFNTLPW